MDNLQVLIDRIPAGEPVPGDFRLVRGLRPVPAAGQVLVRTHWLSLDPYVRSLLSGRHFLKMPGPGDVMPAKAVAEVLESRNDAFNPGELIVVETGLQQYAVSDGVGAWKLHPLHQPHSLALGILGMPGMTAWFGMNEVAQFRAGETVLVSSAAGPVGSMVGQIARLRGGRAIGIAGSRDKCDWVLREARFDACIDYRREDVGARLRELAPGGVDVFFDNTGGALQERVIGQRHLAMNSRVVLCGLVTQYNLAKAPPGPNLGALMGTRTKILPLIVYDYEHRREEFFREVLAWHGERRLAWKEDVAEGLEAAPEAFCRLMRGGNFGKSLVRVS